VWWGQANTESGFSFIVSAAGGVLYVITAEHVALGADSAGPGAKIPNIVAFYSDPKNFGS
jgi:hypothetical protein